MSLFNNVLLFIRVFSSLSVSMLYTCVFMIQFSFRGRLQKEVQLNLAHSVGVSLKLTCPWGFVWCRRERLRPPWRSCIRRRAAGSSCAARRTGAFLTPACGHACLRDTRTDISAGLCCVHACVCVRHTPESTGLPRRSSQTLTSSGLWLSSCRDRVVVLQKVCSDRAMYFSLMNRAFTTHFAASTRSVNGT